MTKLIIVEKKNMAELLCEAMKWQCSGSQGSGTFENEKVIIKWASGHLHTFPEPEVVKPEIDWQHIRKLTPVKYELRYIIKQDFGRQSPKRLMDGIRQIVRNNNISEIILGTDSDREGEAIGWEILMDLKWKGPLRRAWFAGGVDLVSFQNAMKDLKAGDYYKSAWRSVQARSLSDWMYQYLVRAYTIVARGGYLGPNLGQGNKKQSVMSTGRVQTPTLAICVQREFEIRNFVPIDFFNLSATFTPMKDVMIKGKYIPVVTQEVIDSQPKGVKWEPSKELPKDGQPEPLDVPYITGPGTVEEFKNRVMAVKDKAIVKQYREGQKKISPPKTWDTPTAQSMVGKDLGISSSLAQVVLEDLYEQKWITYARTSESALPMAYYAPADLNMRLTALTPIVDMNIGQIAQRAMNIHQNKDQEYKKFQPAVFKNKEMPHHGIIPTYHNATESELSNIAPKKNDKGKIKHTSAHMRKAYLLVAKQFIQSLLPPCTTANQAILFSVPTEDIMGNKESFFKATSARIVDMGWKSFFGKSENGNSYPPLTNGQLSPLKDFIKEKSKTKCPERFLIADLPKVMDSIAKFETDPKLRAKLKLTSGIGTSATRPKIIDTLQERDFIEVKQEKVYATQRGIDCYRCVPNTLRIPAVTAQWEDYLELIEKQKCDMKAQEMRDAFLSKQTERIDKIITSLINQYAEKLDSLPSTKGSSQQGGGKVTPKMCSAIKAIARKKDLTLENDTLTDFKKAKAFLDKHMGK
ncbi:DNA topoisomerase [Vibrio splendidus]